MNPRLLGQDKAVQHQHKDGAKLYQYYLIYMTSTDTAVNTKTHGKCIARS
jgi:hypothetical protein